jgi:hypothetical protein
VQNSSCTFCNKRLLGIELETKDYKVSLKRWVEGNSGGEHRVPLLQDRALLLEFAALFGQVMRSDNIKQQRGKRNHPDEQNKPKLPLGIHLDVDAPL